MAASSRLIQLGQLNKWALSNIEHAQSPVSLDFE
jgi:hypothetical protein